jgi:hypothetical protein
LQFGGTAYTFVGVDLRLCTTSGSASALGTEVSGSGYVPLSVPASTTTFPTISGATTTINNNVTLGFAQSTGVWGTVTTVFVTEHGLNNILYFGDLVAAQTVGSTNVFQFLANNFSVQLT